MENRDQKSLIRATHSMRMLVVTSSLHSSLSDLFTEDGVLAGGSAGSRSSGGRRPTIPREQH
jgi:hypothetical protein